MTWDVVVVGAGPSGALASYELARRGVSVLLLDRSAFPRWKVCGACLSPGALEVLESVGLGGVSAELGGVGLRNLVLRTRGGAASVRLRGSVALSRSAFDASLVRAAVAHGAAFWEESRAGLAGAGPGGRNLRVERGGVASVVRARVVIDASGLGSGLADGSPPDVEVAAASRLGLGAVFDARSYPIGPGELHMAVGRSGYVGLVRVEDGTLNVAAAVDPRPLRASGPERVIAAVLAEVGLPPLVERPVLGWRGTPLLTRSSEQVGGTRLFRIGDAAGYVEPFTGEGMCWALSAGRAAARFAELAVEGWRDELLADWQAYLRRSLGPSRRLCRGLAWGLRRPWLVSAGAIALGVAPALAGPFVGRVSRAPPAFGDVAA